MVIIIVLIVGWLSRCADALVSHSLKDLSNKKEVKPLGFTSLLIDRIGI